MNRRAGKCVILGAPNAGKSTLLNALLGEKLAIATRIPGTSRLPVIGVLTESEPPLQVILADTAGIGPQRATMANYLLQRTRAELDNADLVLLVVAAHQSKHSTRELDQLLDNDSKPLVIALNHIDRVHDKRTLLPIIAALESKYSPKEVVPISAKTGECVDRLKQALWHQLPRGWLDLDDSLTDQPTRFFVAELIREATVNRVHEELPHGVAVILEEFRDLGAEVVLSACIIVEKENHKKIVIGANGALVRAIRLKAQKEIRNFLQKKARLQLWVRCRPDWTQKPSLFDEYLQGIP